MDPKALLIQNQLTQRISGNILTDHGGVDMLKLAHLSSFDGTNPNFGHGLKRLVHISSNLIPNSHDVLWM